MAGLRPKKRGRKPRRVSAEARRVVELERENARLRRKLDQAETIIEVQKTLPVSGDAGESVREAAITLSGKVAEYRPASA